MEGLFLIDDIHTIAPVPLVRRVAEIEVHISIITYNEEGGVVIVPEIADADNAVPNKTTALFTLLGHEFDIERDDELLLIDLQNLEIVWRFAGCQTLARDIHRALATSWDGQSLVTLRDDLTRISIAETLRRIERAIGATSFWRYDRTPIVYQPYLLD
ncbi:MAG: hypothetical protein COU09_03005 [Candidatus Harrisonbacteria bacterium CG10_big_fil_rev_8_21_14_0_10_44_23]|uniref:Uncharacterized protein n=1 Tax=Candidatus Harrisonbacteria bacterium CG10_big_fil_rev_8_21_14_0_10_44_23 TaxID=1974585 RepID=A0A2H0UPH6_9BACT|nr:MAG: hypothetical protein COU09_03005 [Candidatus Harrisonbacteria bacterium CG10_big_fil_rev_8_21_14_0_10_44_23]